MVKYHSEMTHILGLSDNPFTSIIPNEGWYDFLAVPSIKRRYKEYTAAQDLNFHLYRSKLFSNISATLSKMSHGSYIGFSAFWKGHNYSLHIVKEGDKTHFIYVNKGQRHYSQPDYKSQAEDSSVIVFTVDNSKAQEFAKELTTAARSLRKRLSMSRFIHKHADDRNHLLTKTLAKKNQKTGNCSVANSNIAWHFQLASDRMQKSALENTEKPISFARAYAETKNSYKQLRVKDRIQAFQYLLYDKESYISKRAFRFNFLQALAKFADKDMFTYVSALADTLDAKSLNILINLLVSDDFERLKVEYLSAYSKKHPKEFSYEQKVSEPLSNIRRLILSRALSKIPENAQKELINNNMSLLEHASPTVQFEFLKMDFDKYSLFASNEQTKIKPDWKFLKYQQCCEQIPLERKTNTSLGSKKEALINNKLRAIFSYASNNNIEAVHKAFEELCLICCEERLSLTGKRYSLKTTSAKWLINLVDKDDYLAQSLKNLLMIKDSAELSKNMAAIINAKNLKTTKQIGFFKADKAEPSKEDSQKPSITKDL